MSDLKGIGWDEFHARSADEKGLWLREDRRLFHVLLAQQFDRRQLDELGELATRIRFIAKSDAGNEVIGIKLTPSLQLSAFGGVDYVMKSLTWIRQFENQVIGSGSYLPVQN